MSVYKDEKSNTWKVYYRFTDWQGKVRQSTKRGFQTKREALAWEREQLNKIEADLNMTFESFVDIYTADMFFRQVKQLAEKEEVTEQLKVENQMEWVQRINNIRNRAKEIVNADVIYA